MAKGGIVLLAEIALVLVMASAASIIGYSGAFYKHEITFQDDLYHASPQAGSITYLKAEGRADFTLQISGVEPIGKYEVRVSIEGIRCQSIEMRIHPLGMKESTITGAYNFTITIENPIPLILVNVNVTVTGPCEQSEQPTVEVTITPP